MASTVNPGQPETEAARKRREQNRNSKRLKRQNSEYKEAENAKRRERYRRISSAKQEKLRQPIRHRLESNESVPLDAQQTSTVKQEQAVLVGSPGHSSTFYSTCADLNVEQHYRETQQVTTWEIADPVGELGYTHADISTSTVKQEQAVLVGSPGRSSTCYSTCADLNVEQHYRETQQVTNWGIADPVGELGYTPADISITWLDDRGEQSVADGSPGNVLTYLNMDDGTLHFYNDPQVEGTLKASVAPGNLPTYADMNVEGSNQNRQVTGWGTSRPFMASGGSADTDDAIGLELVHTTEHKNTCEPSSELVDGSRNSITDQLEPYQHSAYMRRKRKNTDYRLQEQARCRFKRQDALYRQREQARNTEQHRQTRQDPTFRQAEQARDREQHRQTRQDPTFRQAEQARDTEQHRQTRQDTTIRQEEQARNTAARQAKKNDWGAVTGSFEKAIREGPTHVCCSCGRLWFKSSVQSLSKTELSASGKDPAFIEEIFQVDRNVDVSEFCSCCRSAIKRGKIPKLCLSNGLKFPEIPPVLKELTRLEERLVAPRHVFQTIWPVMGPTGQYRTKGGIINVPVSMDTSVSSLPRLVDDTHVVHLRLARRMEYSRDYASGNIRPIKVYEAAKHLVLQRVYMDHNIVLSLDWSVPEQDNNDLAEAEVDDENLNTNEGNDDLPVNPGGGESLLVAEEGIRMAPGEGYRPISILLEDDVEYLSFPKIFGGQRMSPKSEGKAISYADFAKSVAMRNDRRAVERNDFLLYTAKKLQLLRLTGNISTHLRKRTFNGRNITTGDVLDNTFVDSLVHQDCGYRVLQGIRNSSTHWHMEKLRVLAMLRQFGLPTIFMTLTAAESQWPELIVHLQKVLNGEVITTEEAMNIPYHDKAALIQADAVTCARYFDKRFRECKKTWSCRNGPFKSYQPTHHYYRVEFQHRGSPHVHMLLWLKDAPVFEPSDPLSEERACQFIDTIISCSKFPDDENLRKLVKFQCHKHTRTCKPRPGRICRFGIPFYPMDKTRILSPLSGETSPNDLRDLKETLKKIKEHVDDIPSDDTETRSVDQFLADCGVSLDTYISAVRSSLKKTKIFLRRNPCDAYTNPYSIQILQLMRSNMDIQFVLDAFGCATYIIDYINKSDRGMTDLMDRILLEIRQNNLNLKEAMRKVANAFYNNSEMSIQEAAYNILQMPMSGASETAVFIPTGLPEERVRILKSVKELQSQEATSENIFVDGLVEHYTQRPVQLENICLAEFASEYQFSKSCRKPIQNEDLLDESDHEGDQQQGTSEEQGVTESSGILPLQNNSGYLRKRTKPKVIRYHKYFLQDDEYNYYRSILMLYHPWRCEQTDLLDVDVKAKTAENEGTVLANRNRFNRYDDETLKNALEEAQRNAQEREAPPEEEGESAPRFSFDDFHLDDPDLEADVFNDMGEYERRPYTDSFMSPGKLPEEEYEQLLSKLNLQQREYVMHVVAHFRRNDTPLYHLITGGAGTGKSVLISALFQSLLRIFNSTPEADPDKTSILLCAPTGKAAFNIQGRTLHSAFHFLKDMKSVNELSASVSNSMLVALCRLKVLIIDEISMVSELQLRVIDARLRHLFDQNKPFGGKTVILVGDFFQLPCVFGTPVYSQKSSDPYVEIFGNSLWNLFSVQKLHQIMRQSNKTFQTALNNLAQGALTPQDLDLFRSRTFTCLPNDIAEECIHLFPTNKAVDAWNTKALDKITGEEATSEASDVAVGDATTSAKRRAVENVRKLQAKDTMSLQTHLRLKVGARYMVTLNIDTADGLVNGGSGVLRRVDFGVSSNDPALKKALRVWIDFENEFVGAKRRRTHSTLMRRLSIPISWTPIEPTTVTIVRRGFPNVLRKQFPIVVAEAITIHKSQGSTYNTVAVHLSGTRLITRELLYVACSRATSADKLYIIGDFKPPNPLSPSSPLHQELQRQAESTVQPSFRFLTQHIHPLQVIYHNVQSLPKHKQQIENDSVFTKSDFILLGETWTLPQDEILISDFDVVARADSYSGRKPHGAWILAKSTLKCDIVDQGSINIQDGAGCLAAAWIIFRDILLVSVYANPRVCKTLLEELFQFIGRKNTPRKLIMGDFNQNILNSTVRRKMDMMAASAGLTISPQQYPTTRKNTCLDLILANIPVTSGVYVSLTSFHDPTMPTTMAKTERSEIGQGEQQALIKCDDESLDSGELGNGQEEISLEIRDDGSDCESEKTVTNEIRDESTDIEGEPSKISARLEMTENSIPNSTTPEDLSILLDDDAMDASFLDISRKLESYKDKINTPLNVKAAKRTHRFAKEVVDSAKIALDGAAQQELEARRQLAAARSNYFKAKRVCAAARKVYEAIKNFE